jgi:2-hydroxy-3-keto-5-methylthiopentenyl-1-phosphate phosphatase
MASVFVDYDGTITDLDTFDVLVRQVAGVGVWAAIESHLTSGRSTLRETLQRQASHVRLDLDAADRLLRAEVRFDPTFAAFAGRCVALGHDLTVVSSGIAPLIRRALARNGLAHVALVANEVDAHPAGWRIHFEGDCDNGTDKLALVRAARERGSRTVYIGDGWSDLDAAEASDLRYAKRGRSLEQYFSESGLAFIPFSSFAEIDPATFVHRHAPPRSDGRL